MLKLLLFAAFEIIPLVLAFWHVKAGRRILAAVYVIMAVAMPVTSGAGKASLAAVAGAVAVLGFALAFARARRDPRWASALAGLQAGTGLVVASVMLLDVQSWHAWGISRDVSGLFLGLIVAAALWVALARTARKQGSLPPES